LACFRSLTPAALRASPQVPSPPSMLARPPPTLVSLSPGLLVSWSLHLHHDHLFLTHDLNA